MNKGLATYLLTVLFVALSFAPAAYSCAPASDSGDSTRPPASDVTKPMWVTAYYGFWWQYGVPPSNLPWNSITHVVHFVGGNNTNATYPYFSLPKEYELGANGIRYQDSLIAIAHRRGVKVLVDLGYNMFGGFNHLCALGDKALSDWAHTVKNYVLLKGYDGCDIDFEPSPGPVQREQWGRMLHILRDTLNTLSPPGILTCAVMQYYSDSFNPDSLARLCDQINLMEYDHAGSWNSGAGHNSPLYKNPSVAGGDDSSGISSWLSNNGSIPSTKLGFGVPLYGRIFFGISQAGQTPNNNYQYRWYSDIVKKDIPSPGASIVWDNIAMVPSVSDPVQNHWVTFDDTASLRLKVEFAKRHHMGGMMVFGLGEGYLNDPPAGRDPNELAIVVGKAAGLSYSSMEHVSPRQKRSKPEVRESSLLGTSSDGRIEEEIHGSPRGGPHAGMWPEESGAAFDNSWGGSPADDQPQSGSVQARGTSSATAAYWHTVHYANWEHGDLPPSKIPWQSITHLIHFAGNTLGAQTNGTYPYWQAPSNWEIDNSYPAYAHIGDTLRAYGAKYGVTIEIDAGFNSSNQYYNLCVKGDTAIATWAGQVGHYMVNWNYGGVDFDLEGGSYPPSYGFQKMVKYLRDTLAALAPGKKFYFTASVMPNSGDQSGWGIVGGPNPAINLMDQINPMFYDVSGTFGSPLYKDPNCSTWGSDSSVAMSLLGTGIPASKLGLGYNIQVYHTGSTTACPPGGFGYISKLMNEIQYFPPAAGATIYWDDVTKESYMINTVAGVKVAYEDTLSTYYKADFIKRHSLGGVMGFCLGRGYLRNPPAGWLPNTAVQGMGAALNGNASPPQPRIVITVQGRVFFDNDSDGVKDTKESGIPGWRVWLRRFSPDTAVYSVLSNPVGFFSFGSLPVGEYVLSQDPHPATGDTTVHWTQTYPPVVKTYALTITGDTAIAGVDFGNFTQGAVNFAMTQGWNLISLPLRVQTPAVQDLFPSALGSAVSYDGTLTFTNTLIFGEGYWLRVPYDQNVIIMGTVGLRDTANVMGSWNMIGALSVPLPASAVVSVPAGIIESRVFAYGLGYSIVDTLWPGHGYWVKCASNGQIILDAGGVPKAVAGNIQGDLASMNKLTFRTPSGFHQTLYYSSASPAAGDASAWELPPVMDGLSDIRFTSSSGGTGGSMVWYAGSVPSETSALVALRSCGSSVNLEWHTAEAELHPVLEFGDRGSVVLSGDGSIDCSSMLPADGPVYLRLSVSAVSSSQRPAEFKVYQNYPNPFNPSTVISFDLPEPARVTLMLYNMLGSRVGEVLTSSLGLGHQTVSIDGSSLPSGVYFCRVRAEFQGGQSRTETLRMMLLR